jgi:hypothetical protein
MATASPLLLSSLSKYFTEHPKEALLLQRLVEGTYPVSLRVIDWFITHYSRLKNVLYWLDEDGTLYETLPPHPPPTLHTFHLYYEYRAQLKSYTKMFFDPFRRHDRISFIIQRTPKGLQTIETTAGQLNFFRWAIQNRLLDYIQSHLTDIEETMVQHQEQRRQKSAAATAASPASPAPVKTRKTPALKTIIPVQRPTIVHSERHQVRFD